MTLIEVMVAVSLLALMGTLVYGSLVITITSQQRAEVLQERYHAARIFLHRIKRELSMSYLSLHQAEDQRTQTLFDGEEDRVTFNTSAYEPIRRDAHESDQIEVEYRLDQDDEGNPAIIRRVKYHVDDRPGKGGEEEVVISGVARFELSYYDQSREDWRDDWEVTIDDAQEKRLVMKEIEKAREAVEDMRNDDASGVLGIVAAVGMDQMIDKVEGDAMEDLFLPNRIRIRLVITDDEDREYLLETQTEIRVTDPLWY
jgi:general secretion pathway protein J